MKIVITARTSQRHLELCGTRSDTDQKVYASVDLEDRQSVLEAFASVANELLDQVD